MRDEYNIDELNPRKNPYAKMLKKQVTINLDADTVDSFKVQSNISGIINLYLRDCVSNNRQLHMTWQ